MQVSGAHARVHAPAPVARTFAVRQRPLGGVDPVPTLPAPPTPGGGFAAPAQSVAQVTSSPAAAAAFVNDFVEREGRFFRIARHPVSQLTYDGVMLDPRTGAATHLRHWSAPSKESLDIAILVKALEGDPIAVRLTGKPDAGAAREEAARILRGKMTSYERYRDRNPGYGGMMPWFFSGAEATPTNDWVGRVPGLDNGEWLWSMLTAEHVLRRQGFTADADRYRDYVERVRDTVVPMFYDAKAGKVRGDVEVVDPSSGASTYRTSPVHAQQMTYLSGEHGVHEGQMLVSFLTLFGRGLPEGAERRIWDGIDFERVEHPHGTTWQAYWGSSHESWAYLFQPFRDLPEYRDLFRIREKIRANNAVERGYPGLATSTNKPGDVGYLDGAGIEGIGSQEIRNNHTFAVYGAFPMLLEFADRPGGTTAAGNAGLGWLVGMLARRDMYGPLGGGESATNDGTAVSYMKTIDGSFPNLLAMMGGIGAETADMLRSHGVYDRFVQLFRDEYREAFGDRPLRDPSAFVGPATTLGAS